MASSPGQGFVERSTDEICAWESRSGRAPRSASLLQAAPDLPRAARMKRALGLNTRGNGDNPGTPGAAVMPDPGTGKRGVYGSERRQGAVRRDPRIHRLFHELYDSTSGASLIAMRFCILRRRVWQATTASKSSSCAPGTVGRRRRFCCSDLGPPSHAIVGLDSITTSRCAPPPQSS